MQIFSHGVDLAAPVVPRGTSLRPGGKGRLPRPGRDGRTIGAPPSRSSGTRSARSTRAASFTSTGWFAGGHCFVATLATRPL
eukprot:1157476-Pyramimonas_sp.AAC.1